MDMLSLLTTALCVLAFWLVAALPLAIAWIVACRRRMPREARCSFAWGCLLASHGAAALAAVVLLPLWAVASTLLPWPAAASHPWVDTAWVGLAYAVLGAILLAGCLAAIVLPLKLCRVWPSMRAAARMHVRPQVDPAERHA